MATGKKSFIMYIDQRGIFEKLTNEQAGLLIKHIYAYCADENPECDFITGLAFESIKQALKRDLKKFEVIKEKRSKAGKKSANIRAQQKPTNPTHVDFVKTISTNLTVSDNVNVNDNDNVNDNVNVNVNVNKTIKTYSQEVLQTFDECIKSFDDHLQPKTQIKINSWKDTIEKLIRIEKIPAEKIIEIIQKIRSDDFWAKNFLSIPKLRKKNKEGIQYIVVFNERIKHETNQRNNQKGAGATDESIARIYAEKFAKYNQSK